MHKKAWFLLISLFAVVGCQNSTSSSSSSSSSEVSLTNELTAETINLLSQGYSTRSIFKTGTEALGFNYNYIDSASTPSQFKATVYASSTTDNPKLDKIEKQIHYSSYRIGAITYLSEVELGLDNKVHYYPLASSTGNYVVWSTSGYGNCFSLLSVSDFEKNGDEYSLKLDREEARLFSQNVGSQLTGTMGYSVKSFTFALENGYPKSYTAVFDDISSNYGTIKSEVHGEFVGFGKDVIDIIKPVEGEEDNDFSLAMGKLKKQNYHLDIEMSSKIIAADVEDGKAILYDMFNSKRVKTGAYGYYQSKSNVVQGIIKINDKVYPDGNELNGNISSILPGFNISSVFFDKTIESDKKVYTLKDDVPCKIFSTDYGTLASSNVGKLIVIIENDKVTIVNQLRLANETFVYSNFGNVKDLTSSIQPNCDGLSWSDLISNQVTENTILYKSISAKELDQIPTIGGKYTLVTLDASYNPKNPVLVYLMDDYNSGVQLKADYENTLINNDFIPQTDKGINGGNLYIKEVNIDSKLTKIGVEVFLAADYFSQTQFLIYPSIIE